jgi:fucose 4-O-acetylase-like acetyltransferase
MPNDDPHLQTVPQQIGSIETKIVGCYFNSFFLLFRVLKNNFIQGNYWLYNFGGHACSVLASLMKSDKYYSSFWVESIPLFWWLMVVFFQDVYLR